MLAAGLDIGSRSVELVIVDESGKVREMERLDTTPDVSDECARLLREHPHDRLLVTGYGRALAELRFAAQTTTEIRAHARGARALCPKCGTVLDLGGQDTKVISLTPHGAVARFEMNDRCAAGAGKFLELMAAALGYDISEFGDAALAGRAGLRLTSMCAVFAESEVVGLLTRGESRSAIARAVHEAIHRRQLAMVRRMGADAPLLFSGGGGRNVCLAELLRRDLRVEVEVPAQPEMVGALGAALIAAGLGDENVNELYRGGRHG